ncbi:hypothetical protein KY325_00095 [Candidatus Woesearchaeota archaeon]|nr:hypothetical protein [Candidatus Woesearchaeota archaeon]MBW3017546.1 hypothetical protein [Candidatus Woesearchaeota archaeon]
MTLDAVQKFKLKKFVKDLVQFKGRHTELVSVYVPAGYDMIKIIAHLQEEQGTASNIKSAATRKNVQSALERMIQHLRIVGKTPPNGLAVFSGNVSEREGKVDVQVWSIEPPIELKQRIYRCDKEFVLEPLEMMLESKEIYGMVVMDRREATFAVLKGKAIIPLQKIGSNVPGKTRAGGQCLLPDTKVRLANGSLKKIENIKLNAKLKSYDFEKGKFTKSPCIAAWYVKKTDLYTIRTTKGEIKASKDHLFFVKVPIKRIDDYKIVQKAAHALNTGEFLLNVKGNKIYDAIITRISKRQGSFTMVDITVENQNFIADGFIVHNSAQRFARLRAGAAIEFYKKIAEIMKEQYLFLENLKGILVGGPGFTKHEFLEKGYITDQVARKIIAVRDVSYTDEFGLQELLQKSEDVLASEEVAGEKKIVNQFLTMLATEVKKVAYGLQQVKDALELGAVDVLLISEALPDEETEALEKKAEEFNTEVKMISTDTREGVQLKEIGMVGAILRYPIET